MIHIRCSRFPSAFTREQKVQGIEEKSFPTPDPNKEHWVNELCKLLHAQAAKDSTKDSTQSGTKTAISNLFRYIKQFSNSSPEFNNSPSTIGNSPALKVSPKMFQSSKKYAFVKRSLSSVNTARTQLYSSQFFGNEK